MSTGYEAGVSEEHVQRDEALFNHFGGSVPLARLSQLRAQAAAAINRIPEAELRSKIQILRTAASTTPADPRDVCDVGGTAAAATFSSN